MRRRFHIIRIGRGAERSVQRGIGVGRRDVEEDDIVVVHRRASGGVVYFSPRIDIVVVLIRERGDWIERDGGVERPSNTSSKAGTDA